MFKKFMMVAMIVGASLLAVGLYLVKAENCNQGYDPEAKLLTVDYDRPIEDLIKAGRYDSVNERINGINFPAKYSEKGSKRLSFRLFHYSRDVTKAGYRHAGLRELLAFEEAIPEVCPEVMMVFIIALEAQHSSHPYGTEVATVHHIGIKTRWRFLSLELKEATGNDDRYLYLGVR